MVERLVRGLARGLLFGLLYAWADTLSLYVITHVMLQTTWDPLTTTTLHLAGLMVGLCVVLGGILGAIGGQRLARSDTGFFGAMAAGLTVVAIAASPEIDRILGMALLGIGLAAATAIVLAWLGGRRRWIPVAAAPLLAVVWYVGTGWGVRPEIDRTLDASRPRPATTAPNILWVVFDTTRADHLSLNGYARKTTPTLDALAPTSTVFDRAYSTAPWTLPSHAAMFTGLFSSQHGCQDEHTWLDQSNTTIAQVLSQAGYETALFSGNPWLDDQTGMVRGFGLVNPSWRNYSLRNLFVVGRLESLFISGGQDKGAVESNEAFSRWFERGRVKDRPFFAFINYMEAHAPYHQIPYQDQERYLPSGVTRDEADAVSRKYMSRTMFANDYQATPRDREIAVAQYDGGIHNADARLAEVLEMLRAANQLDNTILIFTSDHGELFGEHNLYSHDLALYHPLVHVPLLIRWPGRVPGGTRFDLPVQLVDLFPTLLELAGIPLRSEVSGQSLVGMFNGGGDPLRPVFAEQFAPHLVPLIAEIKKMNLDPEGYRLKSVQVGTERFIRRWPDQLEQLFDVSNDPDEEHDLKTSRPDRFTALKELLDAFQKGTPTRALTQPVPEMDAQTREQLKAMGYVQ